MNYFSACNRENDRKTLFNEARSEAQVCAKWLLTGFAKPRMALSGWRGYAGYAG